MKRSEFASIFARVAAAYRISVDREFAALGLNAGQVALLSSLDQGAGISQADLARDLGVSAPTVNKTVRILAARGLVRCEPCPDDSRTVRVFLCEKAAALDEAVATCWTNAGERHFGALSDAELLMFSMLVAKLPQ